ncbi:MAG: ion transporter [Armatimonadota bacterium]
MNEASDNERQRRDIRREALLQQIVDRLELPMAVLGLVWLVLLIVDLVQGLNPLLSIATTVIWVIFILEFLMEFLIAPNKVLYLQRNWLTAIALVVPALRVFRVLLLARALRGVRLVRVLSSTYRGMRALGASLGRHGFRYVVALTLVVTFAGAAGMYAFEHNPPHGTGLRSYPEALWWTAMIMTTLGSAYWPQTAEGRVLTLILSLYAFSVFGYVTAAIASFLVGRETEHAEKQPAAELREEIARLREEVRRLTERLPKA